MGEGAQPDAVVRGQVRRELWCGVMDEVARLATMAIGCASLIGTAIMSFFTGTLRRMPMPMPYRCATRSASISCMRGLRDAERGGGPGEIARAGHVTNIYRSFTFSLSLAVPGAYAIHAGPQWARDRRAQGVPCGN